MTDSVSKLKELLFDREAATLSELERRIELVAEAERRGHAEIAQRVEKLGSDLSGGLAGVSGELETRLNAVVEDERRQAAVVNIRIEELNRRAGTPAAMRASIAEVLDDAIVEARETKHDHMTRAVAPLVVKTIQSELRNSQDAMVEALYPITGRLVKAYVASAMKDLMNQMNRRLEMNPLMLRFRSIVSGYSMAELALAETQRLEVEELYLIQRGTGALIQRWPDSAGTSRSNADIHMSGVITAINDFAGHAFQDAGGTLRSLSLDDGSTVFLRASPVHLLAARGRGAAVAGVEQLLDDELVGIVSRLREVPAGAEVPVDLLPVLRQRLEAGIAEQHAHLAQAGLPFNPLKALIATTTLLFLTLGGLYGWTIYEREQARGVAQGVVDGSDAFKGYPLQVEAGWRGRSITLSGIAPSPPGKADLMERLRAALPEARITDGLAVLPGAPPDPQPQIAAVRRDVSTLEPQVVAVRRDLGSLEAEISRRSIRRALDRAAGRLDQSMPEIDRLAQLPDAAKRAAAERARVAILDASRGLDVQRRALEVAGGATASNEFRAELRRLSAALQSVAAELAGIVGDGASRQPANIRSLGDGRDAAEAAEEVGLAAERVATIAAAAAQASAIRIPQPATASGLERLQAFVRTNAVFFGNGDDFRAPEKAEAVMDQLIALMRATNAAIRVVGYTDERGGSPRNAPLSQARADKVMQALIGRGAPRERLSAVGRPSGPDLSTSAGPTSPNRRVEFEIAFDGELAGGP